MGQAGACTAAVGTELRAQLEPPGAGERGCREHLPPAMAQWQKVQELGSAHLEQVHQLYRSDLLPMEVRHCLAAWIEDQAWQQAAEPGSSQARMLLYALLAKLDEQYGRCSTEADGFVLQHNLRKAKHDLQARYEEFPEELANVITNLLREEKRILSLGLEAQQAGASPTPTPPMETDRQQKIEQRLNEIQESMQDLERSVRHLEELQDTFDFVYKINQAHKRTNPADPELQAQTQQLQAMLNSLDQNRKSVLAKMQTLLGRVETLRDFVLKELAAWRERQRQACLGAPHDTALGSLEAWCTGVAGALFQLLRVLRTLQELRAKVSYQHDPLETEPGLLERRIREQLTSLLRSAFVVEEQPAMPHPSRRQLVLRTNQKFSTCIRLLVKLQDRNQQLVVKMECDKDPPNVKGFRRFNILTSPNKTLVLDERHRKGLVCDFRHVTLKEQKVVGSGKGSKGASEGLLPVTEELHLITFTLDYKYQDVELQLQTSTLPVVVISNVCQASAAWASILWFNLLSPDPKDQLFFQAPPPAPWPVLAEALSWQFMAAAGRGLDHDQLHMLAEKLFGPDASPKSTLPWIQFSKDSPAGFSFWTWLEGILELIHKHLASLWKDGLILGFVSKKRERQLLRRRQTGTFLLRFSESCREGGITFTWVEHGSSDRPEFCSVKPYTKVELESLPLADIIRDYHMLAHENVPENPLKLLYPTQPRDEAFGAYYSDSRKGAPHP
ncbi:signal transducer and activator of transcription 3 [Alligator mississippiensis]|uniref:Signal transducer and activator of transcription n=1 Tax=Alligator mississippiensis TaxID=8496 RepID=A0A151P607_ALLMI|nr:signal transducer and activator of transcription 3 [Alligator mississippiensis]